MLDVSGYMEQSKANSCSVFKDLPPILLTEKSVLCSHLRLDLPRDLLPSGFHINNLYAFSSLPHRQHAAPTHTPACSLLFSLFDQLTNGV